MKIRSQLLLSNSLIVGLFIVVVATSFLNMRTLVSSADWVAHTHEVMTNAHRLTKYMVDMETGQRGFMLTGNLSFLEPYNDGKRAFLETHREIIRLVADNPEQTERLHRAKQLYNQWLNDAGEREIELKKMVDR